MRIRRKDREVTNIVEIEKILLQCKTCHVAMVVCFSLCQKDFD
jgi:nitroimidazol reductase NimA-like FMN-containing flavoprotein (pyridoxamine 5'-phosphate oxidase superfamily)